MKKPDKKTELTEESILEGATTSDSVGKQLSPAERGFFNTLRTAIKNEKKVYCKL